MSQILITGATGNIGIETIRYLCKNQQDHEVIAAVRNIERAKAKFHPDIKLNFRQFDFERQSTFDNALNDIDKLFLLRPPHIAKVEKYFSPLLSAAKRNGIEKIVFLSVQGADNSKAIPHNKIEKSIKSYGFKYIFVRPSYFMQNLTTTLLSEIRTKNAITLPAGKAKFNWIDTINIGEATSKLILSFDHFQNREFDLTGSENINFHEVTNLMTELLGFNIKYKRVNPVSFYIKKIKEGANSGFSIVMTMLHFLPRLMTEPTISDNYEMLTGKRPITLRQFILREKDKFITSS